MSQGEEEPVKAAMEALSGDEDPQWHKVTHKASFPGTSGGRAGTGDVRWHSMGAVLGN